VEEWTIRHQHQACNNNALLAASKRRLFAHAGALPFAIVRCAGRLARFIIILPNAMYRGGAAWRRAHHAAAAPCVLTGSASAQKRRRAALRGCLRTSFLRALYFSP